VKNKDRASMHLSFIIGEKMETQINTEAIDKVLVGLVQEIIEKKIPIDIFASLIEEYGFDSIDMLDLTTSIEQIYKVELGPEELINGTETPFVPKEETPGRNSKTDQSENKSVNKIKVLPDVPANEKMPGYAGQPLSIKLISSLIVSQLLNDQHAFSDSEL
jgi:acyl carrier protein